LNVTCGKIVLVSATQAVEYEAVHTLPTRPILRGHDCSVKD
jgi:hypothetical protein